VKERERLARDEDSIASEPKGRMTKIRLRQGRRAVERTNGSHSTVYGFEKERVRKLPTAGVEDERGMMRMNEN
jgi:hypothetical protein